jgi:hypothetical protein
MGNVEGKRPFGRPKRRWKENFKTKNSIFWDITPYIRLTFKGVHRVISQKLELFISTAVRTSNPTILK